eukprot:scaffold9618_cov123-Isochrysis_galbana.AAC.1
MQVASMKRPMNPQHERPRRRGIRDSWSSRSSVLREFDAPGRRCRRLESALMPGSGLKTIMSLC